MPKRRDLALPDAGTFSIDSPPMVH